MTKKNKNVPEKFWDTEMKAVTFTIVGIAIFLLWLYQMVGAAAAKSLADWANHQVGGY